MPMRQPHDKMIIQDGRFYKDGKVVPLEHGNLEQIKLLKEIQDKIENGISPTIIVTKQVRLQFKCVCGVVVEFQFDDMDEDQYLDVLEDEQGTCHNCKQRYIVIKDENEGLILKMKVK